MLTATEDWLPPENPSEKKIAINKIIQHSTFSFRMNVQRDSSIQQVHECKEKKPHTCKYTTSIKTNYCLMIDTPRQLTIEGLRAYNHPNDFLDRFFLF